jgi:hypothetical protein
MSPKPGDLVKIVDPDEPKIDGFPYSTVGLMVKVEEKTPGGWLIFTVLAEGGMLTFDEPFWAAEIISSHP